MQSINLKISSTLFGIFAILSSSNLTQALEGGKYIKSGQYQNQYPDNLGILIEKNKCSVYYDDSPSDSPISMSKCSFKYIKTGVFYSNASKEYYCLIESSTIIASKKNGFTILYCSRSGWKTRYR